MMTIKEFATLCGCNTQTLRYYDKIDLLKPVKVDQWSGYRYYTKAQAIAFVKIKNLQAADFTIDEIKALLTMPDQRVFEAFDQKIAEQAQKLERIKEIQQSYLTEKTNMEKLVQSASDYLFHAVSDFEMLREFGMSPADGEAVVTKLKEFYERTTLRHLPASPDVQMILN
ncbi:MAG: MerR family transcriptional regulator, partial [Clostridia bacterium]|nr:MerR family transcriptional regulator [Clostridia bacterium]